MRKRDFTFKRIAGTFLLCALLFFAVSSSAFAKDPLPSWNEGSVKQAIISFVKNVTDKSGDEYVPPSKRIATFDNDGTLWSEQPFYFQLFFAIDRIRKMAPRHPEWKNKQPFKAVLEGNMKALAVSGEAGIARLVIASHAGMTTDAFEQIVRNWLATAKHPRFKRPFTELVFQPMLELLAYLRANQFKTFIVSGGGIDFMRPWTEKAYGIPPEQVIGSRGKLEYEIIKKMPVLIKMPEIAFIDDKGNKPVAIYQVIGKRPIAAFGNSDGDLQMLQYTAAGKGRRLMVYIHHTDAKREWAYDRKSHIGRLAKGLDTAKAKGWTVVDMKKDWKVIYPFELQKQ